MSLKQQILLIVGIPILGMIIIFGLGLQSFSSISSSVDELMTIENDLATMLNGDRDAYQAFLSEREALDTFDSAELERLDASHQENIEQTRDRVEGPGQRFSPEMGSELSRFQTRYNGWSQRSRNVIRLAKETASENRQMLESSKEAIKAFDRMRDNIDKVGEIIDTQLTQTIPLERRTELERALSLVLNGDRDAYQAYVAQLMVIRATNQSDMDRYSAESAENIAQTRERFLEAAEIAGAEVESYQSDFLTYFELWESKSANAVRLAKQGLEKKLEKATVATASAEDFAEMRDAIDKLGEAQSERAAVGQSELTRSLSVKAIIYIITIILALGLALGIVLVIVRSLLKGLTQCVNLAEKVSVGDFDISLTTTRKDELGRLMSAMNQMAMMLKKAISAIDQTMDHMSNGDFTQEITDEEMKGELTSIKNSVNKSVDMLSHTIQEVVLAAEQVDAGSVQLSSASQSLAAGNSQQAASLQEVSSTMAEVGSQAESNKTNAHQAVELTAQTMDIAKRGNDQMRDTLATMDKINTSSNDISKIIKVIDDIAFQTNLLALNAAVEAARAGSYGKGFAVVAEEVRNLAARSADAAKDTTELIENSVKEISIGFASTQKTADVLEDINEGISKVNDLLTEISVASRNQSENISEINNTLVQVNDVVQGNSSISEETASASEELSGQATQLQAMMKRFRLLKNNGGDQVETPETSNPIPSRKGTPFITGEDKTHEIEPHRKQDSPKMITLDDDSFGKY